MRRHAINLALALASVALTFLALELPAPWLVRHLPLKLHVTLDPWQRVLAQSSKRGAVPERGYVAILGDSFAAGLGDWLLEADPDANPPFHAAHVLHERLGRDVVSFGHSGDGSMQGWVKRPFRTRAFLARTRYALPDPGLFVAYYYEGNDLNDNLRELGLRRREAGELMRRDPDALARRIGLELEELAAPGRDLPTLYDRLLVARVAHQTLRYAIRGWPGISRRPYATGDVNRAWIGGREVALPQPIQTAGVHLEPDDAEVALQVLEESLRFLHAHTRGVPILLVYVPAALTTYRIVSAEVEVRPRKREPHVVERHPTAAVAARSNFVCGRLHALAQAEGIGFADARATLWPLAREQLVHGPRDFAHFNRAGYTALADAIARAIEAGPLHRAPCQDVEAYYREARPDARPGPASQPARAGSSVPAAPARRRREAAAPRLRAPTRAPAGTAPCARPPGPRRRRSARRARR
jgi:hypothetical protein